MKREGSVVQFQESDGLAGQSSYWRSNVEHRFLFGKGLKIHNSLSLCLKVGWKGPPRED